MEKANRDLRMHSRDILTLGSTEVFDLLAGKEAELLSIVEQAYRAHGRGASSLPHSTFLRFPEHPANRIIALPAYLGGEVSCAGVKWISSFPGNIKHGTDRASAVLILNEMATGRPKAILEGSIISARRTAASAALAARTLQHKKSRVAGIVGCGPINFEVVRFLLVACPDIRELVVYDLDLERSEAFGDRCRQQFAGLSVAVASTQEDVLQAAPLICFATTASKPHIFDSGVFLPGATILHVSLRDLSPQVILSGDNVVDDLDHVCRAETSIHLTEKQTGNRKFVRCSIADVLNGITVPRQTEDGLVIFSPFGLGILDIAVGEYIFEQALKCGAGAVVPDFLPDSWARVAELST
jgi:N-[(2S)-2-amino-2-carboxyethyl]-L-glutamate dehydrogenase